MDASECRQRLREASHGVLSTLHPARGVDAVPVVIAVVGDDVVIPVDRVKAKRSTELQRVRNLRKDPRCVLLVDHYDDDWRRLWWVRAHAEGALLDEDDTDSDDAIVARAGRAALAIRFPAYREPDAIASVLRLRPTAVTGWRARPGR